MKVMTLKVEMMVQLCRNVQMHAKRLVSLKFGGSNESNLRATAATLAILTELRNAAKVRPLIAADLQDCIDVTIVATGVEEYEGPMGEIFFRYKA